MNKIHFCEIHEIEKKYLPASQKYQCRVCNREKMAEYRKNNPDKCRESAKKSADRKRIFIKEDKKNNPDKYKSIYAASELCEKHEFKKQIGSDGRLVCRKCKADKAREYRESCPTYELNKLKARLKRFKISVDKYHEMLLSQKNKCAICDKYESKVFCNKIIGLSVDHCHAAEKEGAMKIRGLLCHACNTSLGGFKDDIQILQSAIEYLKKHKDNPDGASSS